MNYTFRSDCDFRKSNERSDQFINFYYCEFELIVPFWAEYNDRVIDFGDRIPIERTFS